MIAYLYWQKYSQTWLYSLSELEMNSSNGLEYHGEYELTLRNGEPSKIAYDEYGNAMVERKGKLYVLRTGGGPYIVTDVINLTFNVKKIK